MSCRKLLFVPFVLALVVAVAPLGCGGDGDSEEEGPAHSDDLADVETTPDGASEDDGPADNDKGSDTTPPGTDCGPTIIVDATALPWSTAADLSGGAEDNMSHGPGACDGSAAAGGAGRPDHVYAFAPPLSAVYTITLSTGKVSGARLYVTTACGAVAAGDCEATATQIGGDDIVLSLALDDAHSYYLVVDSDGGSPTILDTYELAVSAPCQPSCEGKECGDDGCGLACAACDDGYLCTAENTCFEVPKVCTPIDSVSCESSVPADFSTKGFDASNAFGSYSCDEAAGKDFGKGWELTWTFESTVDQVVTVSGPDAKDLRLSVLAGDKCEDGGSNCVAHGDPQSLTFGATKDTDYHLVFDSVGATPVAAVGFEIACCIKDCAGKECGPDGCGGLCGAGTCESGACVEGACTEVPSECTAIAAVECNAPGADPATYGPYDNLSAGVTTAFSSYSCQEGSGDYGVSAELVWSLTAPADAIITVTGADTETHVLAVIRDTGGGCVDTEASCAAAGTAAATFDAAEGETVYLVWDSAEAPFVTGLGFEVSCCFPACDGTTCGDDGCGGTCTCGEGLLCFDGLCEEPQPGESCDVPQEITGGFPQTIALDTTAFHDLYTVAPGTCDPGFFGPLGGEAPDVVFALTPELSGTHTFTLDPPGFDGILTVATECSDLTTGCLAFGNGLTEDVLDAELVAGEVYFIIVDGSGPGQGGAATLTIKAPCAPECLDKDCGSDGCGGSCGSCATGELCAEDFACDAAVDECVPALEVACGETLSGLSMTSPDASYAFDAYSCQPGAADYSASTELTATLVSPGDVSITLALTDAADVHLVLVSDGGEGCTPTEETCLGVGEDGLTFDATADATYHVIMDSPTAADTSFSLTVSCVVGTAGGDACDDPSVIVPSPGATVTIAGDTTGYADKYAGTPCDAGLTGTGQPDVIYALTPEVTGTYTFDLDYAIFASPGLLYVLTACGDETSCLAFKNFFPGPPFNGGPLAVELEAGVPYSIVVDSGGALEVGPFQLTITMP